MKNNHNLPWRLKHSKINAFSLIYVGPKRIGRPYQRPRMLTHEAFRAFPAKIESAEALYSQVFTQFRTRNRFPPPPSRGHAFAGIALITNALEHIAGSATPVQVRGKLAHCTMFQGDKDHAPTLSMAFSFSRSLSRSCAFSLAKGGILYAVVDLIRSIAKREVTFFRETVAINLW